MFQRAYDIVAQVHAGCNGGVAEGRTTIKGCNTCSGGSSSSCSSVSSLQRRMSCFNSDCRHPPLSHSRRRVNLKRGCPAGRQFGTQIPALRHSHPWDSPYIDVRAVRYRTPRALISVAS